MATEEPLGGHRRRHGRPGSWVLVAVVAAAFCAGGVAVIAQQWALFWVCAAVVALAFPAGKLVGLMNDTRGAAPRPRVRAAITGPGSAAGPGVKLD